MKRPWIKNVSFEEARDFVVQINKFVPNTVCISILTYDNMICFPKFLKVLSLSFCDIDPDRYPNWLEAYRKSVVDSNSNFDPNKFTIFSEQDAKLIKQFVDTNKTCNILVHCEAGISRSAAVVEALLEYLRDTHDDAGGHRFPNNYVKRVLKKELGLVPIGV